MKNNYLKIHPLTIIFLFLAFMTGYFRYVIYFMSLIFIHELGHVTVATCKGWKVKKVILLPFGGMTVLEELVNKPIQDEIWIAMMGPIYQHLFYLLLCILGYQTELLSTIHYFLLGFNLLPIYPLDGSKIVLLLLEKIFSFYHSQILMSVISFMIIVILPFFASGFLMIIVIFFLIFGVYTFYTSIYQRFYKFVLERKLYHFSFKKQKTIQRLKQMKRDYRHFFIKNGVLYDEKEYLKIYE